MNNLGFRREPEYRHGTPARTAVLLVNLGTPEAPTAAALRTYLKQFLWDPRVVELPRLLWWPVLNGVVLATRPAKSAEKYAKIWTPDGSPLKAHSEKQTRLLRGYLGQAGHGAQLTDLVVDFAMRYGSPSIPAALDKLKRENCTRILVVPLYPQYAASTTASVVDEVATWAQATRNLPELRFARSFHDHPGYIAGLAASVSEHWMAHGRPDRLVMSFHGLPRFSLDRGDPYHCECQKTARLLAEALGLKQEQYLVTFQSRFGRAEWLKPYTQATLEALAKQGMKRIDVICPGFVSDCLETLEEIGLECKAAFLKSGGKEFHYIPCLNERHEWMAALAAIVRGHLGGWLEAPRPTQPELAQSAQRAAAMGATC
ncbi:MAG: ferrochelatase [Rhodocyclaceae bacterium]|jgi:ferrochelatase|nr:ferrochelatase [Rhodocyclaceae bacterium]